MTWRRLRVLIERLPPESATMTALRNANPRSMDDEDADPAEGRWSQLEVLAATLTDEVRLLRWAYLSAHSEKTKRTDPPEPIRRPGVQPRRKKTQLTEAQYDWLYRHINGLDTEPGAGFAEVTVDVKPLDQPPR